MSDESSSAQEFPDDSNEERPRKDASARALPFGAALSVLVWEDEDEVD